MTALEIVPVDPREDPDLFRQWHEVYAAADRFDRGALSTTWALPELEVSLGRPWREQRSVAAAGRIGGRVVATAWIGLPLLDNRHRAECEIFVHPEHRRQGHGSELLAFVEEQVRADGRSVLGAEVNWVEGAADRTPGVAFARRRGFDLGLTEVRRDQPLPVHDSLLDDLAAEAAERHAGYEIRSWIGRIPDELVAGWAALDASLDTEAPRGDLDLEEHVVDVAAVREAEARQEAQQRESAHTVALARDGRVAAYTHLVLPGHESDRAYQWGTLVGPEHRGRRLGLAVKVANTRLVQEQRPSVRTVVTWNADSNKHMIAINERLGFVPVEVCGQFQKRL